MKGKDSNMTPLNLNNSTVTNPNNTEVDKISDKEFKKIIMRMMKLKWTQNKCLK
jgi:hypothetical protein